jgi:hypothetical protein
MKKLLLSGITAVALMAAGTVQASDLSLSGETGIARTPLAMSLAPMSIAIAADYVFSDATFVPMRAEIGLPYGIEVGGAYWYVDLNDTTIWSVNAKYVLPKFVEGLGLAVGGHYNAQSFGPFDNDGYNLYGVATYVASMGEGMALIPSGGVMYRALTGSNDRDTLSFFGSLLFKMQQFAVGGEFMSADEDFDGLSDGSYWVGGRFYLNPMITLQGGYTNNANFSDGGEPVSDGVFHAGVQFAFSSGK